MSVRQEESSAAALGWIVELLRGLGVPFQAAGGLAARAYGSARPLADLDFYVPAQALSAVADAATPAVVRAPELHQDDNWDLTFMRLEHDGRPIELGGAEGARFRDRRSGGWVDASVDFESSVPCFILGETVPTMPVDRLMAYKSILDRGVDREDIAEIAAGHRQHLAVERPGDRDAIRTVHRASFPESSESDLVDALRSAGRLSLSIVALVDDEVVGHVAFSPVSVAAAEGGAGLAPVAVVPRFRRRGIAAQLIREGLVAVRRAGARFVVVLGDPAYYERFGFQPASHWGLRDEYGGGDACQALELEPGALPLRQTTVRYAPEFGAIGGDA
jgi:putative acetyltransferase